MLGNFNNIIEKAKLTILAIVLTFGLFGCQNESMKENNNNYVNIKIEDNDKEYFSIEKKQSINLSALDTQSLDSLGSSTTDYVYPENIDFIPLLLSSDNILYGEADPTGKRTELYLAAYNLSTRNFEKVCNMKTKSKYTSIGVLDANKKYIVFEESDQENNVSNYYLFDLFSRKREVLHTVKDIPALHYSQAKISDNGIMLNIYDSKTKKYVNKFYDFHERKIKAIENENCGYPVYVNNTWYYLVVNNEKHITQLIKFDYSKMTKKVVYETTENTRYISGLFSDGNNIMLTINNNNITESYKVELLKKRIVYLFESEWIESISINKNFITWLGNATIKDRIRPQYYLVNLDNMVNYINDGGSIFLSTSGIVWINYKMPDKDILKGEVYKNINTSISLKKIE